MKVKPLSRHLTHQPTFCETDDHETKLAIFDREPLFLEGIILSVKRLGVKLVCAEVHPNDLFASIEREEPDIVIMDKIEVLSLIELIRSGRVKTPSGIIVIIDSHINPVDIALLCRMASVGLLHRRATTKELRAAIRNLSAGRSFKCALVSKYTSEISWLVDPELDTLDLRILQSLTLGATKQEAARSMRITFSAVDTRVRKLYRLLAIDSRDDLLKSVMAAMDSWLKLEAQHAG